MKEEALKLADELASYYDSDYDKAEAMIRRLVEELDKQTKPTITKVDDKVVAVTMTDDEHSITEVLWEAPKPLSDEEIWNWFEKNTALTKESALMIARAIEERHGIK